MKLETWLSSYVQQQHLALDSIKLSDVESVIKLIESVHRNNGRILICGNGGNAANASHFATDLGKNGSLGMDSPFKVLSINDNMAWITAIGNDYSFDDAFSRQLQSYGGEGDLLITSSVSGNSPNLVKAVLWAKSKGIKTVALVGAKRGRLYELADYKIVIEDEHYGRVEDCQMLILHMFCYAFVEKKTTEQDILETKEVSS